MHSFTNDLNNENREFDLGILYVANEEKIKELFLLAKSKGLDVRLSEPYDAKRYYVGLDYS